MVTKGTYAKMARGEMVRFMAENNIENPLDIKKFDRLGYSFSSDLSSDSEYVFERKNKIIIQLKMLSWQLLIIRIITILLTIG